MIQTALDRLNRLKNWQAASIILVLGFVVYAGSLFNPFIGDDSNQIVDNVLVHSISNIRLFFVGGTFYDGTHLTGVYYRPLMTSTFSVIYSLFGAHPFYFHLVQLLLVIGSTTLVYLFFRYSFKPVLALTLSLVLLIHPLDAQVVYAIPSMQDALVFFFGILAMYLLVRLSSVKSLIAVVACLSLSLFAKETGVLFVFMALVYLLWWNKRRFLHFSAIMIVPILAWFALKATAVGLSTNPNNAPIDSLRLVSRLLTAPSIYQFFITKLIAPMHIASEYYWIYPKFSIEHVLVPLIIDLLAFALVVFIAIRLIQKTSKAQYATFLFFACWSAIGLVPYSQIVPLDMTVSGGWFYFSMVGVLGMVGVVVNNRRSLIKINLPQPYSACLVGLICCTLVVISITRGFEWRSPTSLYTHNIAYSKEDYAAYAVLGSDLIDANKSSEALPFITKSLSIYPTARNYQSLGAVYTNQGNFSAALEAFNSAVAYKATATSTLFTDEANLTLVIGEYDSNKQFIVNTLSYFPNNFQLWLDLALLEQQNNHNEEAKYSISQASKYGDVSSVINESIQKNVPFTITLGPKKVII